jgi:hypothetical protein
MKRTANSNFAVQDSVLSVLLDSDLCQLIFEKLLDTPLPSIRICASIGRHFETVLDHPEFWRNYVVARFNPIIWKPMWLKSLERANRFGDDELMPNIVWKRLAMRLYELMPRNRQSLYRFTTFLSQDSLTLQWRFTSSTPMHQLVDLDIELLYHLIKYEENGTLEERNTLGISQKFSIDTIGNYPARLGDILILHFVDSCGVGEKHYYVVDHLLGQLYLKHLGNRFVPFYFSSILDENSYCRSRLFEATLCRYFMIPLIDIPEIEDIYLQQSISCRLGLLPLNARAIRPSWDACNFEFDAWFPFNKEFMKPRMKRNSDDPKDKKIFYCGYYQCSECRFFDELNENAFLEEMRRDSLNLVTSNKCLSCGGKFCRHCLIYCETCVSLTPESCFCLNCVESELSSMRYFCASHFIITCPTHSNISTCYICQEKDQI